MWYNPLFSIDTQGNKPTQRKLAKMKNDQVWRNEFVRNVIDAQGRWHIKGLPETCSQRVFQQGMLWNGCVCEFKMGESVLCLPATPDGSGMNLYGDYAGCWVNGANGFVQHVKLMMPGSDECRELEKTVTGFKEPGEPMGVLIWENDLLFPFINQVVYYSDVMTNTLRKIEVAARYAAVGHIFVADESIAKTAEATIASIYEDNIDHVISSGIFDPSKFQAVNFSQNPTSLQNLTAAYEWYANQYRMLCGTAGASNMDKKGENLISDEVHVGDEYTKKQTGNRLDSLQRRLDVANKLFGLNQTAEEGGEHNDDIFGSEGEMAEPLSDDDSTGAATDDQ